MLGFSEPTIDYIALAKKGKRVATIKFHVGFSGLIDLHSIALESVESRLNARIKPFFIRTSRGVGGLVPEVTWVAVIEAVKKERAPSYLTSGRSQLSSYGPQGPLLDTKARYCKCWRCGLNRSARLYEAIRNWLALIPTFKKSVAQRH